MHAIVLTCDRYRRLAEHMIDAYARLWPEHPFEFRVAAQDVPRLSPPRVSYRQSPLPIKATVFTLLEGLADDEWVYWCIDDKYPIRLDLPAARAATAWVTSGQLPAEVSGVLLCRCRDLLRKRFLSGAQLSDRAGNVYLERLGYDQIWLHQFLRVKVLRQLFGAFPDEIPQAKLMDDLKDAMQKPPGQRLFVARENRVVFGESTTRGLITENCAEGIRSAGLAFPEWFDGQTAKARTMGTFPAARWWRRGAPARAST